MIKSNEIISFKFDVPLRLQAGPLLTLLEDSTVTRTLTYPQDFTLDETKTILRFALNSKAKESVLITPDTTKLLTISGERFKQQPVTFTITNKDQGGSLNFIIKTIYPKYILELLDRDFKVQRSFDSPKSFRLDNLEPGTYRFRVKIDEDANGIWRAGNQDLKTVPEKVYNNSTPMEVRANWEQDVILEF